MLLGQVKERKADSLVITVNGEDREHKWASQAESFCLSMKPGDKMEFDVRGVDDKKLITFARHARDPPKPVGKPKDAGGDPNEPPGGASPKAWKNDELLHPLAATKPNVPVGVQNAAPPVMTQRQIYNAANERLNPKDQKIGYMSCVKTASHIVHTSLASSRDFIDLGSATESMSIQEYVNLISDMTIKIAERLDDWMDERLQDKEKKSHEVQNTA